MNKVKEFKVDYKGIFIINPEYGLSDLKYIYEDYILTEIKNALDNNLKTVKITFLGEVDLNELLKYYINKEELKDYLSKLIPTKRVNFSRQIEVAMPSFNKVVKRISSEDDLIEIAEQIKGDEDEYKLIGYYLGRIRIKDLYKQFKGKENFNRIINYVKQTIELNKANS